MSHSRSPTILESNSVLRIVAVDDPDRVHALWPQWDELAVLLGKPYCAPAWMTAWWKHVAPSNANLRVSAMFDGDELVALAPFFADRGVGGVHRYRLIGAGTSAPLDILARPGTERAVATAIAASLAKADPRPDVIMFEGVPASSPWTKLLRELWPGLRVWPQYSQPAPFVDLRHSSYDQWFKSRSSRFRANLRRGLREMEKVGARARLCTSVEVVPRDVDAFARLHRTRWSRRGEAGAVDSRVERMLTDAGSQLVGQGRFQLWSIQLGARDISSHIFVGAGGTLSYWLGGFDNEDIAISQPAIMTILAAIEHAFHSGESIVDLGPGAQPYKYNFSRTDAAVNWALLVPPGRRSLLARAQMLRPRTRIFLAQRLTPDAKRLARRLLAWKGALRRKHAPTET